jgi:hypothetical protein
MARASLDSITFLFQVLMALALTNAAYIYVTGGSGTYALRDWTTFTLYQTLAFVAFVATLIPFAHANVLILKQSYMAGFAGKGLQPVVDFFLLFVEAGIFYALSHALTRIEVDPLSFFYVAGAILVVDVIWALLTFGFDRSRTIVLVYALLNSATLVLGGLIIAQQVVYLRELLLLILGVRTILDYALTYSFLFPNAFQRISSGNDRIILGASIASIILTAVGVVLPLLGINQIAGLERPLLFAGLVLLAAGWILSLIQTASLQQWSWLVGLLVYTILIPVVATGMRTLPGQEVAGSVLLILAPLATLLYSIVNPR